MTVEVWSIVAADDREAQYMQILAAHGPAIRRLAASYERGAALREDLIQDINLAIWLALPSFRGDCSERTFVFRIAHNRGITHAVRARRRSTDRLDDIDTPEDARQDPEREALDRQQHHRLRQAVLELPLGLRQVIVLTLEGLPQREIGDVLGITENSVAVRMNRARKALRRLLDAPRSTR